MVVVFQAVHSALCFPSYPVDYPGTRQCGFLEVSQPHGILTALKFTLGNVKQFQIAVLSMSCVLCSVGMPHARDEQLVSLTFLDITCFLKLHSLAMRLLTQPHTMYKPH